ncbi:unnamed protein product [Parnassius apollo]|uniref:(apollo) hypothetical protein n=1 Tax=Parnassius apollo TaxID=110799 RepID=A0A8S3WN10_PARAO|nr:unnamed protein product [Parnassius apollo]
MERTAIDTAYIGNYPAENVPVVETTQQHAIERQAILCLPRTSGPSSRPSVVRMQHQDFAIVVEVVHHLHLNGDHNS